MPLMKDIGPYDIFSAKAVSAVQYVVPADRDMEIVGLHIMNVSADDNWIVQVSGRELLRFRILQNGTQQLLGYESTSLGHAQDFFFWYRWVVGEEFIIPVKSGLAMQLSSVGGATADVSIRFRDLTLGSLNSSMPNHYQGNRFIQPRYGYLNAAVAAVGEHVVDTEVGTPWLPNVFLGQAIPAGWIINLRALWLEGVSVNTYSGAADHLSSTDHYSFIVDQEPLFTHVIAGDTSPSAKGFQTTPNNKLVAPGGIPAYCLAAAAGSANTVYARGSNPFPPFQAMPTPEKNIIDPMLQFTQGDVPQLNINVQGDVTGNPSYATALAVALVEYIRQG